MKARGPADYGAVGLLLGCLSARVEPAFSDQVARSSPNDWNEVIDKAVHHGLAPLLFRRLKESDTRASVPADAWERLRLAYFAGAGTAIRRGRELRTVLRCLQSHGIPVIVLKGAFLAETVYGDIAVRQMCDVDLMVPGAELPRAQAVLLDMGGTQRQSDNDELWSGHHHLLPVVIRGLVVELHSTIASPTGPFRIDVAGLWDRARPATVAGVEALALSPEDLLLHLSLHICHVHRLSCGLQPLCDISETTHRYRGEMDWSQVAHSAREWGAVRYVGLTLHLARSMMAAEVPDDVLERLVPGGLDPRLLEAARQFVLAGTDYVQWMPALDLASARSLTDKARLVRERLFLSRDEMAAKYPRFRESRHPYLYFAIRVTDAIRTFWSYTLRRGLPLIRTREQDRNVSLANWLKSG